MKNMWKGTHQVDFIGYMWSGIMEKVNFYFFTLGTSVWSFCKEQVFL